MPDALAHLVAEEQARLVDMDTVSRTAVKRVEQAGKGAKAARNVRLRRRSKP